MRFFHREKNVGMATEFYSQWTAVFALLPSGFGQILLTHSIVLWLATGSATEAKTSTNMKPQAGNTRSHKSGWIFLCDYRQMVCQKAWSLSTPDKHVLQALHQMDTWDQSKGFKKHHTWLTRMQHLQIHITIANLSHMQLLAFTLMDNSS